MVFVLEACVEAASGPWVAMFSLARNPKGFGFLSAARGLTPWSWTLEVLGLRCSQVSERVPPSLTHLSKNGRLVALG